MLNTFNDKMNSHHAVFAAGMLLCCFSLAAASALATNSKELREYKILHGFQSKRSLGWLKLRYWEVYEGDALLEIKFLTSLPAASLIPWRNDSLVTNMQRWGRWCCFCLFLFSEFIHLSNRAVQEVWFAAIFLVLKKKKTNISSIWSCLQSIPEAKTDCWCFQNEVCSVQSTFLH